MHRSSLLKRVGPGEMGLPLNRRCVEVMAGTAAATFWPGGKKPKVSPSQRMKGSWSLMTSLSHWTLEVLPPLGFTMWGWGSVSFGI